MSGHAQPQPCPERRDAIVARAEGAADADLDLHVAACARCRAALERRQRAVTALQRLPRAAAPFELDGLAVASLQAGHRQDRAVEAVRALARERAPADLERRLVQPQAPAVLHRLVAEELADPAKANVRRWTGRLERLQAPADLRRRLEARRGERRARRSTVLLGTLGVLIAVGALLLVETRLRRGAPAAGRGPTLVGERIESLDRLDPFARQLLSGVAGGLPDAQRIAREGL
jgi:hypothetical protein